MSILLNRSAVAHASVKNISAVQRQLASFRRHFAAAKLQNWNVGLEHRAALASLAVMAKIEEAIRTGACRKIAAVDAAQSSQNPLGSEP